MVVTQSNKLSFLSFFTSTFCLFPNNLARKKEPSAPARTNKIKVQFGTVEAVINAACACFTWNLLEFTNWRENKVFRADGGRQTGFGFSRS
jgi:hypothetical protein